MKLNTLSLVPFVLLTYIALSRIVEAVNPPPDGGYPGFTTAEGQNALFSLSTGVGNTATGWGSLFTNSIGNLNTAIGAAALLSNTGDDNTATGALALFSNTTGSNNTATGSGALQSNTTGGYNTAVGVQALFSNTQSLSNTAVGAGALVLNDTGGANTAVGVNALLNNTIGNYNVAVGPEAGGNLTTGSNNVYIGSDTIGFAAESSHTYIRNINITSVSGPSSDTVTVDLTTGLLGHLTSSRRYKDDIKPMDAASNALYRLQPVTYRYKKELDQTHSPAFGLIAEEVAQVNPALVACNSQGQPESIHYEMINAMLLNEFLKEHATVQELKSNAAKQEATIAQQQKQIGALTAGLQKVSAQLELNKPAPQTVKNND